MFVYPRVMYQHDAFHHLFHTLSGTIYVSCDTVSSLYKTLAAFCVGAALGCIRKKGEKKVLLFFGLNNKAASVGTSQTESIKMTFGCSFFTKQRDPFVIATPAVALAE